MKIDSLYPLKQGESKLWMVLVGVNHYQDQALPSLRFAVADCEGLAAALQAATRQFPRREILTHYGTAEQPLQQSDIEHSLERLLDPVAGVMPEDILLFFFSGHGVLEPSTHQLYLGMSDTRLEQLEATGLAVSPLLQRFKASGVGQQVIILDACHSGQMHFTATLEATLQTYGSQSQDFQALLSCSRHDQTAWELEDLRHSAFTYALIAGIRGAAADEVGQIDVEHLYRYVRDRTHTLVRERLGQQQIPSQIKVGCHDIIIGYKQPDPMFTFAVISPSESSPTLNSHREIKSLTPCQTNTIRSAQFWGQLPIKVAAGVFVLAGITLSGIQLYQQHTQQMEQSALDRIRQLKTMHQYQDCITEAERFPSTSHFHSAAKALVEQCQSQAWLERGQTLVTQGKWHEAIAQLRQILHHVPLAPVIQQVANQTAQQILNAASQQYQNGDLEQAITLVQMTPQSSSLYSEGQQKIKQWAQRWNQDKNHFVNAEKAKAAAKSEQVLKESEQIKHPYWKQKVAPLVTATKVAMKQRENERQPAISEISPPTFLEHTPVSAPPSDSPVPANQPVSANSERSHAPAPQPATSTFSSAEVERF